MSSSLRRLFPELNGLARLFEDDLMSPFSRLRTAPGIASVRTPAADMYETPHGYILAVDVPGIDSKDLHVYCDNPHSIRIRGRVLPMERFQTLVTDLEKSFEPKSKSDKSESKEVIKSPQSLTETHALQLERSIALDTQNVSFERTFQVDTPMDVKHIQAHLNQGVLEIVVAKQAEHVRSRGRLQQSKRIPVQSLEHSSQNVQKVEGDSTKAEQAATLVE